MEKTTFDEGFVAVPTGVEYHTVMEAMRTSLFVAETERDEVLGLLREVIEADDADDLEEVLTRVREFVENSPFNHAF